jgi:hypothetical protein
MGEQFRGPMMLYSSLSSLQYQLLLSSFCPLKLNTQTSLMKGLMKGMCYKKITWNKKIKGNMTGSLRKKIKGVRKRISKILLLLKYFWNSFL